MTFSSDFIQVTSRVAKVPKIPIDQLISGAVREYIEYVKTDSNPNPPDEQLLPLMNETSEQNSSSDEEKFRTNETTTLNGSVRFASVIFSMEFFRLR